MNGTDIFLREIDERNIAECLTLADTYERMAQQCTIDWWNHDRFMKQAREFRATAERLKNGLRENANV